MNILILGGSGFVGRAIVKQLSQTDWAKPVIGSRKPSTASGVPTIVVDTTDLAQLKQALKGVDAVINCVAGDGPSISEGAKVLVAAAQSVGSPRIIHFSTMSVYGSVQGLVDENSPCHNDLGWYGQAKIEAENAVRQYGNAVILRPGCIAGAGSDAWVARVAYWLRHRQIGDLGTLGDAPANLVDVEDVAQAAVKALRLPVSPTGAEVFNLACPDSPRWNQYFTDLGIAIQATPVQRIGKRKLQIEVYLRGVALKVAERVAQKLKVRADLLPPAIPPSLMRLWSQQIQLDSSAATERLAMNWTPYSNLLKKSAQWAVQRVR